MEKKRTAYPHRENCRCNICKHDRGEGSRKKQVGFSLPQSIIDQFNAKVDESGKSLVGCYQEAIEDWIEKQDRRGE